MSITISVSNNFEFCRKNNLVEIIKEECFCTKNERNNCYYCKGSGEWTEEKFPCEMNISNGNFSTLWAALGLEHDYCGEICPNEIIKALRIFDENLLLRANYVSSNNEGDMNFISFGIDKERALSYIQRLKDIAIHAISRGENITWG